MRFFLRAGILLAVLAHSPAVRAEYRAFTLAINDTRSGQTRLVTGTLDHIQYPGYHPLRQWETIAIQDTWMCWGRQGDFKAICPNPKNSASGPARPPAGAPTTR